MREPPIDEIVRKIVEAFHPRRIVVFGSRAHGTAGPDSDIDLCVEMETALKPPHRRMAISKLFRPRHWAMDVLVYTPEEFAHMRDRVGTLPHTIAREGKNGRLSDVVKDHWKEEVGGVLDYVWDGRGPKGAPQPSGVYHLKLKGTVFLKTDEDKDVDIPFFHDLAAVP